MSAVAPPPAARRRVLIVDAHPVFRDGLRAWLERQPDLECCGEAHDTASALAAMAAHRPHLVTVELRLKAEDGLELVKSIRTQSPQTLVLVVAQQEELIYGDRTLRAGAQGYVSKDRPGAEILAAIRAILNGEIHVSQRLAAVMLRKLWRGVPAGESDRVLSERETQVFQLLGSGYGSREIARRLRLSIKTVDNHRDHIKTKLHLKDATSLIHAATRWVEGRLETVPPKPKR
ncbi:MAG: response regulator transcription factor [Verrucomicrobia bacterium]|nr:response regulator transcription factor [Verrucomicrobiota bacterium]